MMILDCNAFIGSWPFYKTRFGDFGQLQKIHKENGIDGAFVSSIHSIFYNDPWEAEKELHDCLHHAVGYQQVFTVNPTLPAWKSDLLRAIKEFNIYGVRIVPEYHKFSMEGPCLEELIQILREYRLPLFITMHMVDERASYLILPRQPDLSHLEKLIQKSGLRIILCSARVSEIYALWSLVEEGCDLWFDVSGLKDHIFVMEQLFQQGIWKRLKYGSQLPALCLESSKLLVDLADIPADAKEQILSDQF